jgi:D-serine deaminase-like pyridoxal phosphate-dependent protein
MGLNRRSFLAASAAAVGAAAAPPAVADAARRKKRRRATARKAKPCTTPQQARRQLPALGAGGEPTPPEKLAALAKEIANGDPVTFVDLAAFDGNLDVVTSFARHQGWEVRPSLKSFESPGYAAYALARLPEPRGLVFHLKTVDQYLAVAPEGTDLMLGYPPSLDEVTTFLTTPAPQGLPRHRIRILVDSLELLDHLIALAPRSRRGTPVEVALQLEGGLELSGFREPQELSAALEKLRANRDRLSLTAVLCYDGHGTVRPERAYRQQVKDDAEWRFARWLAQLKAEGSDLYDEQTLVRNGPASSTYRLWAGSKVPNEISPGTAFVYHSYLTADGHDDEGLRYTMHHATPVHRIVAPRVPLTSLPDPRDAAGDKENVSCKGAAWPDSKGTTTTTVWPSGLEEDELSGGRGNNQAHYLAPKGVLRRGDYIVVRPKNAGDGADHFGALVAVRDGTVRRIWPTLQRPGSLAALA